MPFPRYTWQTSLFTSSHRILLYITWIFHVVTNECQPKMSVSGDFLTSGEPWCQEQQHPLTFLQVFNVCIAASEIGVCEAGAGAKPGHDRAPGTRGARGGLNGAVAKEHLACAWWEMCRTKSVRYIRAENAISVSSWFHQGNKATDSLITFLASSGNVLE